MNPARKAALEAVSAVERGRPLQEALSAIFAKAGLDRGERAQASDLAYGYFRTRKRLELTLALVLPRPDRLPRELAIYLALAVYSLLFQERSAVYAVFDGTVAHAGKKFGQKLAGVANAALRSLQRMGGALDDPQTLAPKSGPDRTWRGLAAFYSMPQAIADLWRESYGEEAALKLMQRSFARPYQGIRLVPAHPAFNELRAFFASLPDASRAGSLGFALPPGSAPASILGRDLQAWAAAGALEFQAAGSQIVLEELGLGQWPGPVWDCCAGVGGKSRALADLGVPIGLATDTSKKRLAAFRPIACLAQADAASPPVAAWPGQILVDAPCSGLGVLARRPDIREAWLGGAPDLAKLAVKQLAILAGTGAALRSGGEMAYVTCSLNPGENGDLVRKFLGRRPEFRLVAEWQTPHDHPWLEGMYGALLRKQPPLPQFQPGASRLETP